MKSSLLIFGFCIFGRPGVRGVGGGVRVMQLLTYRFRFTKFGGFGCSELLWNTAFARGLFLIFFGISDVLENHQPLREGKSGRMAYARRQRGMLNIFHATV